MHKIIYSNFEMYVRLCLDLLKHNDEDSLVLQTGLDQTLLAYDQLQKSSIENENRLRSQMNELETEHLIQVNRMMGIMHNTLING